MSTEKKNPINPINPIEKMTFEDCFSELETLVEKFEQGKMPLAEMLEHFERGMTLIRHCTHQLNEAETMVNSLVEKMNPDPISQDSSSANKRM